MERLCVYVGAMPRMARDITTRALTELGTRVLDAPLDPTALRSAPGGPGPVLILSSRSAQLEHNERRLLAAAPQAVVVVFDPEGRQLTRYELWPRRFALGELSVDAITAAIRTASSWDERFRA